MAVSTRKILIWGAAAAVVGAGLYFGLQTKPVPVDIAAIGAGPMEVTLEADGTTRVREVFEISSPVAGTVQRSPVAIGDPVVAGETLVAVIKPVEPVFLDARSRLQAEAAVEEARAALELSESSIEQATADYEFAIDQYERSQTLYERGTITYSQLSQQELMTEQARTALEVAISERDLRASSLERSQAMLVEPDAEGAETESCCIELHAPVSGTVLSIPSTSQRVVPAGAPLLSVGDTGDLELAVDLLSSDVVKIAEGARAYVERWGGEGVLEAKVARIEPAAFTKISALGISEQRVRVLLDFVSPPEDRAGLGDGFRVFIRVVEWSTEDTLQVPISALFRSGDDWAVFVLEDGKAVETTVTIGRRNASVAQVLSGLEPGDTVITHPGDRVADGVAVVDRDTL